MLLSASVHEEASNLDHTVQHFLGHDVRDGHALASCAVAVAGMDNCWLIPNVDPKADKPGMLNLDDLEMRMLSEWLLRRPDPPDIRFLFRPAVHSPEIVRRFQYILFDCPPRLTTACVSALSASDLILVPVQPETVAIGSVHHLLRRLARLRQAGVFHAGTAIGVIANMVPERAYKPNSAEVELLDRVRKNAAAVWGSPVQFFETLIPRAHQYVDATRNIELGSAGLRLAISYPTVRRTFEGLWTEIERMLHERVGTSGVPA
jgi:cellulose biosynthesis protein BcsQ